MTADQVSAFFDAGETFVEGTIAAALVALWLLAIALHLARPYMLTNLRKFTLRLGADLWWIIYVGLRDMLVLQVFLGSFIFFYPDVVTGKDLPITGGLAAVCAFAVLLIKLTRKGDDTRAYQLQAWLLGLGSVLYIGPYLFGVQVTEVGTSQANALAAVLDSAQNPDVAVILALVSAVVVGVMGIGAVVYNLRNTGRRPSAAMEAAR